jgi:hypothetical protein
LPHQKAEAAVRQRVRMLDGSRTLTRGRQSHGCGRHAQTPGGSMALSCEVVWVHTISRKSDIQEGSGGPLCPILHPKRFHQRSANW